MAKRRAKGEGSIYFSETLNLWVAQINLPNGKRKTKYSKTQKVVKDWLLAQRNAIRQGLWVEADNVNVSDYLDRWLNETVVHTVRPKTFNSYKSLVELHIRPTIGYLKLASLRPENLQSLYAQKQDSGLSPRTVQYIHAVIHRALEQALKWGLVVRNVADLVDAPRPVKKTPLTFTETQTRLFLDGVKDHRWFLIYLLAIVGGLREGELLGLHIEDISLENKLIYVHRAIQALPGKGLVETEPKTETAKRLVTLPDFAIEPLSVYIDSLNRNQGLLFTTSTGKPISPRNLLRHFHETLDKLGIEKMPFHSLRHLSASLLLKAGVNPKVVQERLGHSTITLTLDTYSHLLPGIQEDAAKKMDGYFNGKD